MYARTYVRTYIHTYVRTYVCMYACTRSPFVRGWGFTDTAKRSKRGAREREREREMEKGGRAEERKRVSLLRNKALVADRKGKTVTV